MEKSFICTLERPCCDFCRRSENAALMGYVTLQ